MDVNPRSRVKFIYNSNFYKLNLNFVILNFKAWFFSFKIVQVSDIFFINISLTMLPIKSLLRLEQLQIYQGTYWYWFLLLKHCIHIIDISLHRNYHYHNTMIKKINCSAKRDIFHDSTHSARSVLDIGSREGNRWINIKYLGKMQKYQFYFIHSLHRSNRWI